MVKLTIIAVGKDKDRWVSDGCAHFIKLLKRFAVVDIKIVPSVKGGSSLTPNEIKKKEAERILNQSSKGPYIALANSGKKMDTKSFSRWLEKQVDTSGGNLNFIIGGAYGLHQSVLSRADQIISLSPLTFSHQIVRLTLLEQLYRALSITHGTDYHK